MFVSCRSQAVFCNYYIGNIAFAMMTQGFQADNRMAYLSTTKFFCFTLLNILLLSYNILDLEMQAALGKTWNKGPFVLKNTDGVFCPDSSFSPWTPWQKWWSFLIIMLHRPPLFTAVFLFMSLSETAHYQDGFHCGLWCLAKLETVLPIFTHKGSMNGSLGSNINTLGCEDCCFHKTV